MRGAFGCGSRMKAKNKQRQKKTQIPFGDDNQKNNNQKNNNQKNNNQKNNNQKNKGKREKRVLRCTQDDNCY